MNDSFTIVHLSDFHFSPGADKANVNHTYSIPKLIGIAERIKEREIDRVIISGDITDEGDRESLIRARSFLFGQMQVGPDETVTLSLDKTKVGVVPGNHDAFNSKFAIHKKDDQMKVLVTKLIEYRQKSLAHYNDIFPEYAFSDEKGCRYDFIEKGNRAVFIVYVDTCYFGDRDRQRLVRFERIARGKLANEQSDLIVKWFLDGLKGNLPYPSQDILKIPAEMFRKSVKIVVGHHYIFEPAGFPFQSILQIFHKKSVFTNLASSDIDIYLCGHKHVSHFWSGTYGTHFDRRGRAKHLINIFRRMMGMRSSSATFRDRDGKFLKRNVVFLGEVALTVLKLTRMRNARDHSDHKFGEDLAAFLEKCLNDPQTAVRNLIEFLKENKVDTREILSDAELEEIHRTLCSLSKEEIFRLIPISKEIHKVAKKLGSRSFVQVMAGTCSKKTIAPHESSSFNIYTIEPKLDRVELRSEKFEWEEHNNCFSHYPKVRLHEIHDSHKAQF